MHFFQMFHAALAQEKLLNYVVNHHYLEQIGASLAKKHKLTPEFSRVSKFMVQYTNSVAIINDFHAKFKVTCFDNEEQKGGILTYYRWGNFTLANFCLKFFHDSKVKFP